jgi:G3E family GTPase
MEGHRRIPVMVLTGYLGSGKTTLLNWILSAQHGKRIAVIENEFGEVGIDDGLVTKFGERENVIEMNNGCICCTVRGDLIAIIKKLEPRLPDFDMIVIETTGLADPAPVCQTFFVDESVAALAKLDAVVTVVDAHHILQHLDEIKAEGAENEAVEQVAFADRILLNKTDLATAEELAAIEARIKSINAAAPILRANLKVQPCAMDFLMGVEAFSLEKILSFDPTFLQDVEHQHDKTVTSVGLQFEGDLSIRKLNAMISNMLKIKGADLLRYKGILSVKGSQAKFVFQGVHMLFDGEFAQGHQWQPTERRVNKFVFIGKNLDRAEIEANFRSCLQVDGGPLRFAVGANVLANTEEGWVKGKIIALWEDGNPYVIKLKGSSTCVFAPEDLDLFVKADTAASSKSESKKSKTKERKEKK